MLVSLLIKGFGNYYYYTLFCITVALDYCYDVWKYELPCERQCSDVLRREEDLELPLEGLLDLHCHHAVHS